MALALTRNDILIRLRKTICCVSRKAEEMSNQYSNGIVPSNCDIRNLKLLTAIVDALRCYTPPIAEVLAEGSFTLSGTSGTIWITVNGIAITAAAVAFNTDVATTLTAIETAIDADATTPNYTASISGTTLTITAVAGSGNKPNDYVVTGTAPTGDLAIASVVNMTGGVSGITDDNTCFTLLRANVLFSELEELTGITFAAAGATYIDPVALDALTEDLQTQTGERLLTGTAALQGESLRLNIRNQNLGLFE